MLMFSSIMQGIVLGIYCALFDHIAIIQDSTVWKVMICISGIVMPYIFIILALIVGSIVPYIVLSWLVSSTISILSFVALFDKISLISNA